MEHVTKVEWMFSSGKDATVRGRKPHCREPWLEAGEAGRGESGIRYHVVGMRWVTLQRAGHGSLSDLTYCFS